MNKIFKFFKQTNTRIARQACRAAGLHPARLTDVEAIRALMRELRPVTFGRELIRVGPDGDGGYLIPDDLEGIAACFSPGVSHRSGFELECAERGMEIHLADKSVTQPAEEHPRFHFLPKFLGAVSDEDFMTLGEWVAGSGVDPNADLMLQMDIEGFEYEVLFNAPGDLLGRFRIIAVEFHWLDQFWNEPYFNLIRRAIGKLLQTHACVHHHPNNAGRFYRRGGLVIPPTTELTFLRRDRVRDPKPVSTFPHPLDRDNAPRKPSVVLPRCWYE